MSPSELQEFKPHAGVPYRYDYIAFLHQVAKKRARGDGSFLNDYRWMCQNDLFFLIYFILGKQFINDSYRVAYWWVNAIREFEEGPDSGTLDLWFRGSGKSTVITVAETIQDILKRPWERIGIFAYARPLAMAFLREIKTILETNDLLKAYFPDILYQEPKKQAVEMWSLESGIAVKRPQPAKEATVEAWGLIDSQPIGRHFTKLVYDDVVTRDSVQTSARIAKVLETFQLSLNLTAQEYRTRFIGTRYDFGDLYGWMEGKAESGAIDLTIRKRPIYTEDATGERDYNLFTQEEVEQKLEEMGEFVFSAQNLLNPVDPKTQPFRRQLARYWTELPPAQILSVMPKVLIGDMASWDRLGKAEGHRDDSALIVIGRGVRENDEGYWYILEAQIGRFNFYDMVDMIFESNRRWKWDVGYFEEEKLSVVMQETLTREMATRWPLRIRGLSHQNRSKDMRIQALKPTYDQGLILFHPEQTDLLEQFWQYPKSKRRDGLDVVAYARDVPELRFPGRPSAARGARRNSPAAAAMRRQRRIEGVQRRQRA